MDDPWDVKSVRQAGQYTSCMKLNGSPLLPPVLSKECRKEMQYYRLLAKEVEKRISILQPYVPDSDTESNEDRADAPQILENRQNFDIIQRSLKISSDISTDKPSTNKQDLELPTSDVYSLSDPNVITEESNFVIDFSFSINQTSRNVLETVKRNSPCPCPPADLPERDYNCVKNKELIFDVEKNNRKKDVTVDNIVNFSISLDKDGLSNPFPESISSDRHTSLGTKSFTGSLNDLHTESVKSSHNPNKLVRQRSYTLLKPSPQLLAHLEVQSLNTGVEMSSISMSESLSNLSSPNKKRRSWDLESAKVKWSSMALELKQKKLPKSNNSAGNRSTVKSAAKKSVQSMNSPPRAKSVSQDKNKRCSTSARASPKSEPVQRRKPSPVRNTPSNVTLVKGPTSPKPSNQIKEQPAAKSPPHIVSESEDPAAKVRELYDKIQKQQLAQMATLVEKQKREQVLLQQVFEEQNNLLYKQLKTIVPKSSIEAKEAWGDKSLEADRGPVSLSQLIDQKSPEISEDVPLSSTLNETNTYINRCDNVLKKSRDISSSIKKPKTNQNGVKTSSPKISDGSRTRTNSPARNTSRKLNYDTSASSDRDYDHIFTDRTNDTMADLNVTFPTDNSEECPAYCHNNTVLSHLCGKEITVIHSSPCPNNSLRCSSTDSAINCMEQAIQNSINSCHARRPNPESACQPTPAQREAASKIVAWCKGHLVRRLMRTERVTGIVQTIRDALLCALQLHQDREGIRGADVDLHRRLIQQITAACYSLHDTFIASSPAERCAMLSADRSRRRSLANRPPLKPNRHPDIMSQSHSGVFPARPKRVSASLMTQSTYESYSSDKARRPRYMPSPRRRPWR